MFFKGFVAGKLTALVTFGCLLVLAGSGNTERASGRAKFDFSVAETYCPDVGPCRPGQERKPKDRVERHHDGGMSIIWTYPIS